MAFCSNCGASVPDGAGFCVECGAPMARDAVPSSARQVSHHAASAGYAPPAQEAYHSEAPSDVLGVGAYVGFFFLMMVPLVGLIFAIVWACGARNPNLKNLSRTYLILTLISIVLSICLFVALSALFSQLTSVSGLSVLSCLMQP